MQAREERKRKRKEAAAAAEEDTVLTAAWNINEIANYGLPDEDNKKVVKLEFEKLEDETKKLQLQTLQKAFEIAEKSWRKYDKEVVVYVMMPEETRSLSIMGELNYDLSDERYCFKKILSRFARV